jgi:hypothetical protein
MAVSASEIFLRVGFWFGNLLVRLIEKIIPKFRDVQQDMYGFRNYYLQQFNLSNKERFKRNLKLAITLCFTMAFWAWLTLMTYYIWKIADLKFHLLLLKATGITMGVLFLIFVLVAYKASRQ